IRRCSVRRRGNRPGLPRPTHEETPMRFIITARRDDTKTQAEDPPFDEKVFTDYMRFNEEMQKAGVLIASEGLNPGGKGARVGVSGGKRKVIDGPFAESKELVG